MSRKFVDYWKSACVIVFTIKFINEYYQAKKKKNQMTKKLKPLHYKSRLLIGHSNYVKLENLFIC